MKIITVPGIHSQGEDSTDLLGSELRAMGFEVVDVDQARRNVVSARWKAKQDAQDIIKIANDGDVLIGHSYGGLKSACAMAEVKFSVVILFRPAMSKNYTFPENPGTRIYCIYSKQDYLVLLGGLFLWFDHPFGLAGFSGFNSPGVTNIESHGLHGHDFSAYDVKKWARFTRGVINSRELQHGQI